MKAAVPCTAHRVCWMSRGQGRIMLPHKCHSTVRRDRVCAFIGVCAGKPVLATSRHVRLVWDGRERPGMGADSPGVILCDSS